MGEKERGRREKPEILGAADLVHLNRGQRLGMLGSNNWRSRRDFLKTLLGAAAVVALPLSLVTGCAKHSKKKPPACACEADSPPCTCEADTPCTCEADTPCTCESDGSCTCESDTPCTCESDTPCSCEADTPCTCEADSGGGDYPIVVSTTPADGATVDISLSTVTLEFSKPMDQDSFGGAIDPVTFTPVGAAIMSYNWLSETTVEVALATMWEDGITYTCTIAGTVTDVDGNPLDGNDDGTGGDPYSFQFTVTGGGCTCESDVPCSCQSDGVCTCQYDIFCPVDGCLFTCFLT